MADVGRKKWLAEKHLAGLVVHYLESGGEPDKLLLIGDRRQYEILVEALDVLEWYEAAGRVRAWIERNRRKLYPEGVTAAKCGSVK